MSLKEDILKNINEENEEYQYRKEIIDMLETALDNLKQDKLSQKTVRNLVYAAEYAAGVGEIQTNLISDRNKYIYWKKGKKDGDIMTGKAQEE